MNVVNDIHSSSLSLAHPGAEAKTKTADSRPPFDYMTTRLINSHTIALIMHPHPRAFGVVVAIGHHHEALVR
jgi:hypothetical protein